MARIFQLLLNPQLRKPDPPVVQVRLNVVLSVGIILWAIAFGIMLFLEFLHAEITFRETGMLYVPIAAIILGFLGLGWVKLRGW